MRFTLLSLFACGLLVSGCAYQGTVMAKEFRALPFLGSLGLKGIYRFELRDRDGQLRHQMVTPNVFANYEVGEYFNDLQVPRWGPTKPEPMMIPALPPPLQEYSTPYWPVKSKARIASPERDLVCGRKAWPNLRSLNQCSSGPTRLDRMTRGTSALS